MHLLLYDPKVVELWNALAYTLGYKVLPVTIYTNKNKVAKKMWMRRGFEPPKVACEGGITVTFE